MQAARRRLALLLAAALLAGGCASVDPFARAPIADHLARRDGIGDCARLLQEIDRRVVAAGARDAQDLLLPGYPYLRSDRLGAALGADLADADRARVDAWLRRLVALDRRARWHELRNAADALPVAAGTAALGLDACRNVLLDADSTAPGAVAALRAAAQVPDDYADLQRVLGAYWLTRIPFAAGVRRWQRDTQAVFAQPLESLPVGGELRRYAVEPAGRGAAPRPIARDALGLPRLDAATLATLLQRHAPVLEIDHQGSFDRPAPLAQGADGLVVADLAEMPVVYTRLAFARFGGALRPQLVYTVWFAARPKAHALDLLGGHLDALLWRVTLDDDGRALLYDSIHGCGCYALFFPTRAVAARPGRPRGQGALDEGRFEPQAPLAVPRADERVVLRIAGRSHYLQRAYLAVAPAAAPAGYRLADEDELRSLPAPGGGTRSVYDAAGMLPGSERLERWLFWPMGIASAGQMRQWGRHATAFVGRRHFDDPDLLDRYYMLTSEARADAAPAPQSPILDSGPQ